MALDASRERCLLQGLTGRSVGRDGSPMNARSPVSKAIFNRDRALENVDRMKNDPFRLDQESLL